MHDNRCKPMIKYSTFYLIILPLSSWVGPWPSSWFPFLTPGWDFLSSSELFVVCWHTVCWYSFCRRPEVPEWWPVVLQAPKNQNTLTTLNWQTLICCHTSYLIKADSSIFILATLNWQTLVCYHASYFIKADSSIIILARYMYMHFLFSLPCL